MNRIQYSPEEKEELRRHYNIRLGIRSGLSGAGIGLGYYLASKWPQRKKPGFMAPLAKYIAAFYGGTVGGAAGHLVGMTYDKNINKKYKKRYNRMPNYRDVGERHDKLSPLYTIGGVGLGAILGRGILKGRSLMRQRAVLDEAKNILKKAATGNYEKEKIMTVNKYINSLPQKERDAFVCHLENVAHEYLQNHNKTASSKRDYKKEQALLSNAYNIGNAAQKYNEKLRESAKSDMIDMIGLPAIGGIIGAGVSGLSKHRGMGEVAVGGIFAGLLAGTAHSLYRQYNLNKMQGSLINMANMNREKAERYMATLSPRARKEYMKWCEDKTNEYLQNRNKTAQDYSYDAGQVYAPQQSYVDEANIEELRKRLASQYRHDLLKDRAYTTAAGAGTGAILGHYITKYRHAAGKGVGHPKGTIGLLSIIGAVGANKIYSAGQSLIKKYTQGE